MNRYLIEYIEKYDDCSQYWQCFADNAKHAIEQFSNFDCSSSVQEVFKLVKE